jgi:hypothetical protein
MAGAPGRLALGRPAAGDGRDAPRQIESVIHLATHPSTMTN